MMNVYVLTTKSSPPTVIQNEYYTIFSYINKHIFMYIFRKIFILDSYNSKGRNKSEKLVNCAR